MSAEGVTETFEQFCQRMLNTRGYIVVAWFAPLQVGDIVPMLRSSYNTVLQHKTVVSKETDRQDMDDQLEAMGWKPEDVSPIPEKFRYFYRVTAE